MAPSVGNANQLPKNQNTCATPTTEPRVHVDTPGPSQRRLVIPPMMPTNQYPMEDIREEVQRRIRLAREREIPRQVDQILERDRLFREERDRLDEEATRAEQKHRARESYHTRTISYRPSVVHQTAPPADANAVLLQELLMAQKREFDEFKQTVLASLPGRASRTVPQIVMSFTTRLNAVPIPTGFILPQFT
ncbi:hypothetical protein LIER_11016 [Lithospermum erythrorhizon]|uniref:Uncharacterized protein n=1 Tax=Lithospermum erythrorhizon TaxID=34254 RepID=A0AAV3PN07_LITER